MIGSTKITLVLGSALDNTSPTDQMKAYVRALAEAGLSVLLIAPGTKIPDDVRSTVAKKKAAEAGDDRAGLYLATSDKATLARYVDAARKKHGPDAALNFAVHPGRSRLVIIDADTPAEVQAWRGWWAEVTGQDMAGVPPTVTSPGAQGTDGAWKHHGGGHWYLTLPEDFEWPEGTPAKVTVKHGEGQFTAYIGDCYVLIPPSTRPEGRYEMTGTDYPVAAALLDALVAREKAAKKDPAPASNPPPVSRERAMETPEDGLVSLETWLNDTPWADVLTDWTPTGRTDPKCGCQTWTAPGVHDSPKSAVTHEDCGDHTDGGRLQVWTDNPSTGTPLDDEVAAGRKTFSKLQAYAFLNTDGDVTAAMDAQGIDRSTVESGGAGVDWTRGRTRSLPQSEAEWDAWADEIVVPRAELENLPGLEPLVEGWLNLASTAAIIGAPGSLKSFHVVDLIGAITTGQPYHGAAVEQGPVLLAVGEGLEGMDVRLRAWEIAHNGGEFMPDFYLWPTPIELHEAESEKVAALARKAARIGAKLVVFDTLARFASGANDSSSQDMGVLVTNLDAIRDATKACVMVVHHTTRDTDHGRGSTALLGAWDTEILAKREGKTGDTGTVQLTKQKHGPEGEPVKFMAKVVGVGGGEDSLVITHETDVAEGERETFARPEPKGEHEKDNNITKVAFDLHYVFRGEYTPYSHLKTAAKKRLGGGDNSFWNAFAALRADGRVERHPEDAADEKKPHLSRWRVADPTITEWAYASREEVLHHPVSTVEGVT